MKLHLGRLDKLTQNWGSSGKHPTRKLRRTHVSPETILWWHMWRPEKSPREWKLWKQKVAHNAWLVREEARAEGVDLPEESGIWHASEYATRSNFTPSPQRLLSEGC